MNTMDNSILYKLGLNDKEIEIYLFLIKSGVQTVKQISDTTGINRTTAYRYLETLREKGLVEWVIDEPGAKIKTTEIENLSFLLNSKKSDVEEIEKGLPQFISNIKSLKPVEKFATQVRYYKGKKGIEQMIWNTLKTKETMRSFTALGRREFINSKFEEEFEEEWVQKKLKDKLITNENRLSYIKNKMVPLYRKTLNVRIIPKKKFYITNDIAIYNDTVSIISLEKDNLVGIEIENAEMSKTQKSIFDIVWEIANNYPTPGVEPARVEASEVEFRK